ncbi:tail tape measure protein [Parerythrobacter jejuensis]|uniref:Tail tape measure protein n=1 Tax=Parerythrobacter jejuensis TaxID=795812 RepID=A0A845AWH5_9SPHN|nr:tail tape measure protein [Parerythrobacter jejuensis]MXP30763.1 tail tape measure protein [Parerythrobacter jejuensis]MXP33523.1 tail tape measure protein [Parerythrobacter jejuensis]
MDDSVEEMLVEVRASTQGFSDDIAQMRGAFDTQLVDGFSKAGSVLERGLVSAIRKGSLSFEDLRRNASRVLDQIASEALQLGLDSIFGGGGNSSGAGGLLGGLIGGILGLPGRATGGPVSPGRGYLVGERGPELFVPTSAGKVQANGATGVSARSVNVAIKVQSPRGTDSPVAMQRSSRQVASAVRRALIEF